MARDIRAAVMKKKLWRAKLDVGANLRRRLPKMAAKYFRRGRRALDGDRGWDNIHQFRLATKRFRYTLELFRTEYGPGLGKKIEDLRHIQTQLGDANDCIVTSGMLEPLPGTEELRAQLAAKADAKLNKLRLWWRANLGAEGAEERWIGYLQRVGSKSAAAESDTLEVAEAG